MKILNYTTEISVDKTSSEIQEILRKAKATAVLTEFNDHGILTHISFKINTKHGLIPLRLPANIDKVYAVLLKGKNTNHHSFDAYKLKEQAARVAWRIIKVWLDAQLALTQTDMVEFEQVFLSYIQSPSGKTVYELFYDNGMKSLGFDG